MKYAYNTNVFINEDAISFYLLGAFCTDGCMTNNQFVINSNDRDWLVTIKNLICPEIKIGKCKTSNCYGIQFTNKQMYRWLCKHGCLPRKSLTLRLPKIPRQYLFDFIRGCFDGDGSIGIYRVNKKSYNKDRSKIYTNLKSQAYICSASKKFITDLQSVLAKEDIYGTIYEGKIKPSSINGRTFIGKNPVYRLCFTYRKCFNLLSNLYVGTKIISMQRKTKIAKKILKHYQ